MKKISLFLALFACLLIGCDSSKNKTTQCLRVNFLSDPPTLDPRKGGDPTSSTVQFMLYEGLTRMTKSSSTEPALAKTITISQDQTVYTFYLRESFWIDGQPVTAYDFEASWKKMMDPSFPCPNANLLYPIKNAKLVKEGKLPIDKLGVRSLDASTFEVTLEGPTPYFLELTSFCVFSPVPLHIVEKHPSWANNVNSHLITNGPFVLKKWKLQDQMVLEKNTDYWDSENVQLEKIHISFIENEMTALQMYESGNLDFLGPPFTPIPLDSLKNLKKKGELETKPLGATTYCSFNINRYPFQNSKIRKAFSFAINREDIVKHMTALDEEIATSPIPSILKFKANDTFFKDADQKEARFQLKQGLEELGMSVKDLSTLTFMYVEGEVPKKIAQALQQQWFETLGVEVRLECYTLKVYLDKLVRRDYDFAFTRFVIQYNDIMNILDLYKFKENPKNYPGWENAEFTQILNDSMEISDQKERISYLKQAEAILVEEMPLSPVYHWNQVYLNKPYLKEVYISPIGSIHLGKAYIETGKCDKSRSSGIQ